MANKKQSRIKYEVVDGTTVSFQEFYAVYAVMEKFDSVPEFHWQMIDFLSKDEEWEKNTGVMQCFRGASKSSLTAAWVAWRLAKDPTLLFLIMSADDNLAMKMSSDISKIITNHPHCTHLLSPNNKWTERGFQVRGATNGRNLSVTARGIRSNVTGFRSHIIVYDDCEVRNTSKSQDLRDELRIRISETARLLHPNGKRLFIGTPHSEESIYPELILAGASSFKVPFLENIQGEWPFCVGESNWPDRWPLELIQQVQESCKTRSEFFSQYQLIATSSEDNLFDMALIKAYRHEPEYIEANGSKLYRIDGKKIRGICAWWDPALGLSAKRDASVLAIVFTTDDGPYWIHRTIELKGEVEEQCKQVKDVLLEFNIPTCYIETNGPGATFPQYLLKAVRGLGIGVVGKHSTDKKSFAIETAYAAPLSAGILYVHESVMNGKFASQLRDFDPKSMRGHDDFIDAPARAIHVLPSSYGRNVRNTVDGFTPYRPHGDTYDIKRDYGRI